MKKISIVSFLIVVSVTILSAQDKKLLKIESLYKNKNFTECITESKKYISDNPSISNAYYYVSFSYFNQYKAAQNQSKTSLLSNSVNNLLKARQKDKTNSVVKNFESEYNELHDTLLKNGQLAWAQKNTEGSKFYFENLAKIYNDTTEEYYRIFNPEKFEELKTTVTGKSFAEYTGPTNKTDITGKRQGIWIEKYDNGKRKHQINFVDDKPVGQYLKFYPNGDIKAEMNFDDNSYRVSAIMYNQDGSRAAMGFYVNQKKDSLWQYFMYDSLLVLEENYKMGVKNGPEISYFIFGMPVEEINYKNGIKHGTWKRYYQNGAVVFETQYDNGKLNGLYTKYFQNGQINITGKYVNDMRNDKWLIYETETSKQLVLEYINGKPKNEAQLQDKETEWFKKMEDNSVTLPDPQKYLNNPDEYIKASGGN